MEIIRKIKETRKRIWEVDCTSVDLALAGSFDWKELSNFLDLADKDLSLERVPESFAELDIQGRIHHLCHSCNPVSARLENLLNEFYKETLANVAALTQESLAQMLLGYPFSHKRTTAALCWALGTDPRAEVDCARRRFYQRFQVTMLRRLH